MTASVLSEDLSPASAGFARFLRRRYQADDLVIQAATRALEGLAAGHSLVDLAADPAPFSAQELARLAKAPACSSPLSPLVLEGSLLYLRRSHQAETGLAVRLAEILRQPVQPPLPEVLQAARSFFNPSAAFGPPPDLSAEGGQLQAAGALMPFYSGLTVLSGGPGTGKTTVLAKILALQSLQALALGQALPRLALAAPTGKAAQRMGEALRREVAALAQTAGLPPEVAAHLQTAESRTLHRLLGLNGSTPQPLYHASHPLNAELVVVDEASMVDLSLFHRLLEAVPPTAKLILLGDPHQLASVDAGTVYSDLCQALSPANSFTAAFAGQVNSLLPLPTDHIRGEGPHLRAHIQLVHSYRFRGDQAIGLLSRAVNQPDPEADRLKSLLTDDPDCQLADPTGFALLPAVAAGFAPLLQATTPQAALEAQKEFMVLTALNQGPGGRQKINDLMLEKLGENPILVPIIIKENDVLHDLYNGDLGLLIRQPDGTSLAWFGDRNTCRSLPRGSLPAFDYAFAITIHKSQGSEFNRLLCLLPNASTDRTDGENPLLGRELLYTAITRAKKSVTLVADFATIWQAAQHPVSRASGLEARLRHHLSRSSP